MPPLIPSGIPLAARGPVSTSETPILMGVPVATFAPAAPVGAVEPGAAVPADPVEPADPALLGAAVVAVEDFDDDPHAVTRAPPSKALPAIAAALRPRFVKRLRRGADVAPAGSSAVPSWWLS